MDIFQAAILGVVEGITEFLPISSTGHLILAVKLLGIPNTEFVKSFEVIIQSGAILAVVLIYAKRLLSNRDMAKKVIIAFIPTGVIGLTLYKFIKGYLLGNSMVVVLSLLIGGIALIVIELYFKKNQEKDKNNNHNSSSVIHDSSQPFSHLTIRQCLIIGLFQSVAIIPGVSRAASTIVGGMVMGLSRREAVEFSFMLAIPTMLAATGLDLLKSAKNFSNNDISVIIVGLVVSFIVSYASIKFLLRFIQNNTFVPFGIYRIAIALLFLLLIR